MRKLLFIMLCFLGSSQFALAQMPTMQIQDKDSAKVILKTLSVKVKVVANIAITTMEMEFCNSSKQDLEGELVFPLPDGVSVDRFALDINGFMREAVAVEKEKGQVVFENTIRKKIDPALLEKLEGNTFKTRIYPLPAGGCRRILIGYQQTLTALNAATLVYELPLQTKKQITRFTFEMDVFSKSNPEVSSACNTKLVFTPRYNAYHTEAIEQNFKPSGSFKIVIPKLVQGEDVIMHEKEGKYYFLLFHINAVEEKERVIPKNIQLIWDNSYSGLSRDHKKEIAFVQALVQKMQSGKIALSTIGFQFKNIGLYTIENGTCQPLVDALSNMIYDGATNLSQLKIDNDASESILISDGLNTWGILPFINSAKPLHTVTAAVTANFGWLQKVALQNNGRYFNLNTQLPELAAATFTKQQYHLIGIKTSPEINSIFDNSFQNKSNLTVTGISCKEKASITLQYGYGSVVDKEVVVELDANKQLSQDIDLDKIAAQQQIAFLELEYDPNKAHIDSLGKKFNIVTRNTSLIVLDDVADYLRYGIQPPPDLKGAYDSLIQSQQEERVNLNKTLWEETLNMMNDLLEWHKTDFSPMIQITVVDGATRQPIANASVSANGKIQKTNDNGVAIFTGIEKANIEVSALNYTMQKFEANGYDDNNRTVYLIKPDSLKKTNSKGKKKKAAFNKVNADSIVFMFTPSRILADGEAKTFRENTIIGDQSFSIATTPLSAAVPFLRITANGNTPQFDGLYKDVLTTVTTIEIKQIDSKKSYIKVLKSQDANRWYVTYLQLRRENIENPSFFVDVAKFFASNNQKELALQILSNIADMNTQDHESYKMLAFELKQMCAHKDATRAFKKILEWRKQEPQSHRDYALSLAAEGKYQNALDTLYLILNKSYNNQLMNANTGIEETILLDINSIINLQKASLNSSNFKQELMAPLDVDVRVVLNWNMNDSDMDLWVTDPRGEKCYYGQKQTKIGGRMSDDFTSGYGPEQFLLHKALKGKYKVQLHYYGDAIQKLAGGTTVMAEIYTNYGRSNQESKMITLQLEKGEEREGVLVGEFRFE